MKNSYNILVVLVTTILFSIKSYGQGTTCAQADPFCTINSYTFPNNTGTSAEGGNDYGCLSTQPNPAWYYMEIDNSGSIGIGISQQNNSGAGIDVDFILYGPYANLANALSDCGNLGNPGSCSGDHNCSGEIVDCSYDPAATETASIPSAVNGEVYLMLITNYSNQPGQISFEQNSGTGSTNCDIVFPPSCGTVDFHAEENASPYNTISPFPSSMTCEDDWIYLVANDSNTAGGYITPALHFEFTPSNDPNDYVNVYSGGTGALGSGTLIYNGPLNDGIILTLYGEYLSPSTNYYFEICDETSVDYFVYDGGLGTIYASGTEASGAGCTRFGPFSPAGSAGWASSAPGASIGANDAGLMYFDPVVAGPGSYQFQYTWNNGAGCTDTEIKTITVTNPYSFTSLSYNTVCKAAGGTANASLTGTSGGTFSSGTLGASLNTTTGAVNIATAPVGTHTVNYSVGTMPCGAAGSGTITIVPDVNPAWTSPGAICEAAGSINLNSLVTGTAGGTWSGTGVSGNTFNPAGLSGAISVTYSVGTAPCVETSVQNITVNPDPTIGITTASECENIPGSGEALNIDVTALETAINATGNITWYTDNTYITSYNPTNETVSNGEEFYFEVELNGCVVQGTITYSVSGNIVLNDPAPEFCEDVLGGGSVANVDLTTFNNSVFAGASSYTWATGPIGVTINDGDSINVQVQQGSCPTVDIFVHFTVNPLPTATISGGGTICAGDAIPDVTITLTGTGPWSVTYTDGTTPVTINPASSPATLSGLADGTYTITAVSDNNCTGTFSGSATILTNTLPTATISGGGTICAGDAIPDVTITLIGTGPWSVTYTDGTTPVTINPATSPVILSGLADGTYTVTAVSDNNCTGTFSGSATILTNPLPTAIDQNPQVCEDASTPGSAAGVDLTTLNNSIDGGAGNTLTWYTDAGLTLPVGTPTNTTVNDNDVFYVLIDNGTCSDTAVVTYDVTSTITLTAQTPSLCEDAAGSGTVANVDLTSYNNAIYSGGATFDWYQDAGLTTPVVTPTAVTVTNGLTFYVDVTDGNCKNNSNITFTINPTYFIQESDAICSGGSYTFPDGTTQTNITTQVIYNSNLTTTLGCDSIVETTVNVNPTYNIQETVSVCSGGSYTFPDGTTQTNITAQVIYNSNLTTTLGCDSIVETIVNVNPTYFNQESTNICSGGSYTFPDGTTQTNITAQVVYNSNLTTTLGCDSIIETTVNVDPQLSITADPVAPICFGENLTLTATGSGNGTVTWYSDAAGTNVIGTGSPLDATSQVSTTGIHTFYVNEAGTCASALTAVNVIVGGVTASIAATPTTGFMPLDVVFSNNSSTGPTVTYDWNFGDGTPTSNSSEPTHTYTDLGNYVATLIVSDGVCSDTASVTIEVIGQSTIIIPNVFTPNGDGSNDVFTVEGTNLESVEGEIFNRWGQKMFEWKHVKGYWDGRTQSGAEAPDGTYFYIIKATGMDGVEYFKKGGFSLIR